VPHRTAVVRVQWRVMAISLSGNFERSDFWRSVRDIGDGVLRDRGLAGWTVTFRPATAADMQHMDTDGVGQDDAQWTLDADAAARSVTVGVMAGSAEFIEPGEVVGGVADAIDRLAEAADDDDEHDDFNDEDDQDEDGATDADDEADDGDAD